MRLSGLVVAAILSLYLVFSAHVLFAQHSSGGSSGGHSAGSSGSSFSSSGSSHGTVSSGSVSHTGTIASHSSPSTKSSIHGPQAPEEKRSFFHPFRKPAIQAATFPACRNGSCGFCRNGGSRNASGACVITSSSCPSRQQWNGFSCGAQGWFNDCRVLAEQLSAEQRRSQGRNNPGQSLRNQMLQDQYEQCLSRFGFGAFASAYSFNNALLMDMP